MRQCQEIGLVAIMFFFELLFSYVSSQFPSMFSLANCHGMTFSDLSFHQDYPLVLCSWTDSLPSSSSFNLLRHKDSRTRKHLLEADY